MKTHILENWNDGTVKVRGDRSMSKEELYQSLWASQAAVTPPEPKPEAVTASWAAKVTKWLADKLLNKVPLGYEDETGFHYGKGPAKVVTEKEETVVIHE